MNDENKTEIYEIVAWKVKREAGSDAYEMLLQKQDMLAEIVNAG